jgi:vanillate O-demethylase monooxygenase subunit
MGPETQAFLMNTWYVAAWDHELIDGKLLARTILDKPVMLYKGDSGRVAALDNRCCHRGAKLSNGRMEGDDIRCMYHGLKFDPSGKCIQIPGQDNIPKGLGVRSYPVVERQHLVWIWMGDRQRPTLRRSSTSRTSRTRRGAACRITCTTMRTTC